MGFISETSNLDIFHARKTYCFIFDCVRRLSLSHDFDDENVVLLSCFRSAKKKYRKLSLFLFHQEFPFFLANTRQVDDMTSASIHR